MTNKRDVYITMTNGPVRTLLGAPYRDVRDFIHNITHSNWNTSYTQDGVELTFNTAHIVSVEVREAAED